MNQPIYKGKEINKKERDNGDLGFRVDERWTNQIILGILWKRF